VEIGHNVKIGYFAQNQAELLDQNATVLETLEAIARNISTQQLRSILGSFLFSGDAVEKKVKVLSGGEKGRLALARLLLEPVNLLILDEPTNHLDMRSKDILKGALNQYNGTMILVSHDREFLDGLCNKVFEFNEGRIREFPGGIFEFLQSRKLESLRQLEVKKDAGRIKAEQKQEIKQVQINKKPASQLSEKEVRQLQTQLRNCEVRVSELEVEIKSAEEKLADPDLYSNQQESAMVLKKYEQLKKELDEQMLKWEELLAKQENS
jgi:ATP-binding cassette subfamily F protein 3